jgi:GcrA cell cycle regulator
LTLISEYQKFPGLRAIRPVGSLRVTERQFMESSNWAPEHSAALRELVARGMSYSEVADAINAKFGTCYTRNAAIGRGKRMGLGSPELSDRRLKQPPRNKALKPSKTSEKKPRKHCAAEPSEQDSPPVRAEPVKLRCVGISPRLLSLIDLEDGGCRYPYGGDKDGEAIAFCGHPRLAGSSYCAPHFHLTRDGNGPERMAGPIPLRLVEAA